MDPSVFNTAAEQHSFDNLVDFRESVVPTWSLQIAYTMIRPWLLSKDHHIMLVGPEACGKRQAKIIYLQILYYYVFNSKHYSLLMNYCLSQMRSIRTVTIYCTACTTPQDVLNKLLQVHKIYSTILMLTQ